MKTSGKLSVPAFFDPANAGLWDYTPNSRMLFTGAQEHRQRFGIPVSANDRQKVHLLVIDAQKDFCHLPPKGTLYVGGRSGMGAIDDNARLAVFIYRNLAKITQITPTLDTHFPFQIFFPSFWHDENGQPLQPHDQITGELVIMRLGKSVGKAQPNPAVAAYLGANYGWLSKQVKYYCEQLEKTGRYLLYIWPEHCMLGSDGHPLVGVIQESILFHAYVRQVQNVAEVKGGNPLTENYSVLGPEVTSRFDGQSLGSKNTRFIEKLLTSDAVIIAGQAASHCVLSTIDHLLSEILTQDPSLAKKVFILRDCTSAVAVPNPAGGFFVDFTPQAEAALQRFSDAGMNVVLSTDQMESWPGMNISGRAPVIATA